MRKYSFIIPTYQSKALLENTLLSFDNLKRNAKIDFEVVICDDGSSDGTSEMLKKRKQNYILKFDYIERDEKSGRSRARNRAISISSGDILVFIDGDILVPTDYLLTLDKFYDYNENLAVCGFRRLLYENVDRNYIKKGTVFNKRFLQKVDCGYDFRHCIFKDISYNSNASVAPFLYALTCNASIPKKTVVKIGGFDENFTKWGAEDIELFYRGYLSGTKIIYNNRNFVVHQYHGSRQGKIIEPNQVNSIDYSCEYFKKIHPEFLSLKGNELNELFYSLANNYSMVEPREKNNRVVFHLNKKQEYNYLLMKIKEYLNDEDTEIYVFDNYLKSDIDILIQLLPKTKATIRYFPKNAEGFGNW